jgi:predicted transposase YbfD/YdcC
LPEGHCRRNHFRGGGDYVVGLKGNQRQLHEDIALYMDDVRKDKDIEAETAQTSEKNRDRFEQRTCFKAPDISWIESRDEWRGFKGICAVHRRTAMRGEKSDETSYYLSSLDVPCEEMLRIVREHWQIESMHWMLDVVFTEDDCRLFSANSRKSMNVLRKLALALHKNYVSTLPQKTKPIIRRNMRRAIVSSSFSLLTWYVQGDRLSSNGKRWLNAAYQGI